MQNISFTDIIEYLGKADLTGLPTFNISVLRNIMVETIEPYLRYYNLRIGLNAQVSFGEYDNVFKESVGGCRDLLNKNTDCVLVFQYLDNLSLKLSREFAGLSDEEVDSEVQRIKEEFTSIINGIRSQTNAMILWHGLEQPISPLLGIWDCQVENGQMGCIRILNAHLRCLLQETSNAYFIDMNLLLGRIGENQFYDSRYWHIGKAPYSRKAIKEISFEDFKFIRPLKGKNKKCLVLDCDNTLWGGILGEDGLPNIKLDKTYPGSGYLEFQKEILNFYNRGIILALCSKNNENDVWEVFQKHPDMVLQERHISVAQINWNDKASNLRQIAIDLNIGLDSIVFVDDSAFEINLIRQELPEVDVIHLPEGRAFEYRNILASCGLFDTLTLSEEDKKRGEMYKVETKRKNLKAKATDLISYYRSLEMKAHIHFADNFSIPRIAQQTQKTNQFNLTTRRYNESDIKRYAEGLKEDVLYLKLADKFGDSGIVGTCILRYKKEIAIIDTFLLSCRVLGRGVEKVFLTEALKQAKKRKCSAVVGEYYKTKKNKQVEFFYFKQGFNEINPENSKADRVYQFDLETSLDNHSDYFSAIITEIE